MKNIYISCVEDKKIKSKKKYSEIAEYPFWSMGCLYYYV